MAEILKYIQKEFVPMEPNGADILTRIPFGGDQLTEERAINTQKAFLGGENQLKRLQGLQPKFEDWHLKKTLYVVSFINIGNML